MTDDKAIEAALNALFGRIAWGAFQQDITRERMRAAIAAADRVRAEGFDELWQELVEKDDRTSPAEYPDMALITREELHNAFIAGLAKGEAERSALVKVLEQIADEQKVYKGHGDFDILPKLDADEAQLTARSALALVRKGV